jgi:UDP-N-acetylmuramate: L-alanyl-gamma-D-glutamyl-meso-diaminopimelate ligase
MQDKKEKVHFIAIGGSVMHNLAIALHKKGLEVTGSDDEIFEPSYSRLKENGILPESNGWNSERITKDLDAVILGMHARANNPELIKAQEMGIKIYSFPEYIYQHSQDKQRIVIAGSHGKTTITSIILHVLKFLQKDFDYLVGASIEGFDLMVKLTKSAPIIVIEGDEYPSSPLDKTPKFLHYHHHLGLVSGIAWDHINVYPTFDSYAREFDRFADITPKAGTLIYCEEDNLATVICGKERTDVNRIEYKTAKYKVKEGKTILKTEIGDVPVQIFGRHNMQNLEGARHLLKLIGVTSESFYAAIQSFKGANNRQQLLASNGNTSVFKDFAHAPSKLEATTKAVKEQFIDRKLIACFELHTFSSLNKNFLSQYQGSLNSVDEGIVYYNPKTVEHKKMEPISKEDVYDAFQKKGLKVFTDSDELKEYLSSLKWDNSNLLMMSSGNFGGIDLKSFAEKIITK